MDAYKKIFRSSYVRLHILNCFRFVPDKLMLRLQYRIKLNRRLDLKNPKRFTEKIQWYKMNYRNPIMHQCVDKYLVRDYIKSKGLEDILIPLIKKYSSINDINWNELPDQFVMKSTHGGGGLNVVVCRDKRRLDFHSIRNKLHCPSRPIMSNTGGREWAYYGLKPGIIVEQLLSNKDNPAKDVKDYKIFCYSGLPKYIVVDIDRFSNHKRNFYDINWNNLNISSDCDVANHEIERPENFDKMIQIASILSEDFPFVRVDLYNISGKIYFGELTFYPWSGYVQYYPDEFDYKLGNGFKLYKYRQEETHSN